MTAATVATPTREQRVAATPTRQQPPSRNHGRPPVAASDGHNTATHGNSITAAAPRSFQRPSNVIITATAFARSPQSDNGSPSHFAFAGGYASLLTPSVFPSVTGDLVLEVPLTPFTVSGMLIITAFTILGAVYLYKLVTQHACACPLCKGEYTIEDKIGSGGFGSVYTVSVRGGGGGGDGGSRSGGSDQNRGRLVLKSIPVSDINDATEAQREAKDLRFLRHPRIVKYVNDFLHSTPAGTTADTRLFVCIVMEWCKYDLRRYIQRTRKKGVAIPEALISKWASQLVSALK